MAQYRLEIKNSTNKELFKMHPEAGMRLLKSILNLASNPRPRQSSKLTASENSYRLKVGVYRVLYQIDDDLKSVMIYKIGHGREVYR